jgi:uncharacterized ubiquitin-like protein YukD
MDYKSYLGYKVEYVCHLLDSHNIKYVIKETWDTRKTKMGNDQRIIKIIEENVVILYTAFF